MSVLPAVRALDVVGAVAEVRAVALGAFASVAVPSHRGLHKEQVLGRLDLELVLATKLVLVRQP